MMRLAELDLTVRELDFGTVDAEADRRLADYFIATPQVDAALDFRSSHILGRKGSGKSSIFTQLPRLMEGRHSALVVVGLMTPDQYAWGALRQYEERGLLAEQAHTNAWKFTIAVEAATALLDIPRDNLSEQPRRELEKIHSFIVANYGEEPPNPTATARRLLNGLRSFNLEAYGFGIGVERDTRERELTPQVIDLLLDSISQVCDEVGVLVAADRLDDSWDGSEAAMSLLIGLLKATKQINDQYSSPNGTGIHVISFLRSDIYQGLRFDDKDKHRPVEEEITWTPDLLKEMISARLPEGVSIDDVFEEGDMRGNIAPFNYLVKRTFLRPREVIQFLQECQKRSPAGALEITKDVIREAEERYSNWKVDDLKQEYRRVFPQIDELIEALRQTQHRHDSVESFTDLLEARASTLCDAFGTREVMKRLFDASIIGVRLGNAGSPRFRCEDADLLLPNTGSVYVHQSLYKGLSIRETRAS